VTALQTREDYQQLAFPGSLSPTAMELQPGLSKQAWLEAGRRLALIERANRWWIGDYLNYGERSYGNTYTEALRLFELDYDTLAQYKWMAGEYEPCTRVQNLRYAHHRVVAALEPEARQHWLVLAEAKHWSERELKAQIKAEKAKPLPTHTPLLRFCQDLPTPIIVAQILRVYFPAAESALDLTGGDGGFWDGSELLEVTRLVVDPSNGPDEQEDFRSLPHIADGTHDVTLFDPPHVADANPDSIMAQRFGTMRQDELEEAVRAGCREAWRICRLGTVVKVTDHVHSGRYILESDWVRGALGQPPFDEVYQVRASAVIDPKWKDQMSAYNNGSTYLVFRKDGPLRRRG